ncbi:dihydrofolate reductase [Sinorhizobium medicae]|uniref:Dihydrofolate reductase n=2 Tax=Sinorhizobium medicae TaxID=110321 RepID=A0A6G1WJ84_9HYPH|nr:dihydrofolate reductase family protein [Sinorhizobium medicae]ABR60632.1 bifunctional deaminase-reductase domain protein [Sinorhizobium medicae WSM419]MBO1944042.1 dihydrofolate reductase [Sinorhizobium medicae]MBO1965049.1 dihydrofolate reductase [Sinorhizobium medicae]MDX0406519.1 dihydrofolate reductase [Sinorhizobium medicae]MDX0413070.1 dihydrofolate reductase [Sinorhizobium medicae]
MRKIIVGAFISLDGIMQAPGGPHEDPVGGFYHGGWAAPYFDETMGQAVGEMFSNPFDLLLGRKTYDIFAAHWPYAGSGDPIGPLFDRITKYVATRNPSLKLDWQNSRPLGSDTVAALGELKSEEGADLLTQGSTDFLQTLFRNDLVDELHISCFPIVLGKGKRLFGDGAVPMALKLVGSKVSGTGVTISKYVRNGPVVTGSFEFEQPTAAELERRRKLT